MTFLYKYQDRERGVLEGEIRAADESAAYSGLRKSGIRPMKVWPKPGVFNRISAIGKRGTAIIALGVLCLALAVVVLRTPRPVPAASRTLLSPLPRQQVPQVEVRFAFESERVLAMFARPGDLSCETNGLLKTPAAQVFADLDDALRTPIRISPDDGDAGAKLKRIVTKLKDDVRAARDAGESEERLLARLIGQQRMEVAYRNQKLSEVRRDPRKKDMVNEELARMGLKEIAENECPPNG